MALASDFKTSFHIDLTRMADSFRVSRIFLTAVELHIFETFGHQELTAKDIAARTGTNEHATEIFLNALAGLGLLEKQRNRYANAPIIVEMLSKESSECVFAGFRHLNNSWQSWSSLTQVVKTGYPENRPWSRAMSNDLAMTMKSGAKDLAVRLNLMLDFSEIRRICDMGCGPGATTMELLQMYPYTTAVLIDHDKYSLNVARQDALAKGLQDRVEIVQQNILNNNIEKEIEKEFDMVIISLVLCLFTRQEAIHLLNKVKAILQPGGTLILGEILLKDSKTSPVSATLFDVQLLVNGSRGGLFSLKDIRELMRDCGIQYERNFPTNLHHIIVGKNEPN